MRNTLAYIKTLILFSAIAFAGHVLATPEFWFSGIANGTDFVTNSVYGTCSDMSGVTVESSRLQIDLDTNTVFKLIPSSLAASENKRTCVVVDNAVFTPTSVEDIDNSVVVDSQTALTVAYENSSTNYYAYITNNWVKLEGATPSASEVDVTVVLDYSVSTQTNVTFKVDGTTLHDEGGNETFPITTASDRRLNRIDLAGYGKLHSITSTVEAIANLTIVPGDITYGADFTNVTITATITGEGAADATYKLNWGGNPYDMTFTHDGNTYTLSAQIPFPTTGRESATYTISATYGGNPAGTSESTTTVVADVRGWIDERSETTKLAAAGGSWDGDVDYDDGVATLTGEQTFTASNCSTGDLVTITFSNIVYAELSDLTVETPSGTQGAFALAETSDNNVVSTNFFVLTKPADTYEWVAATCAGVEANTNISYTVEMSFNYASNTYSVVVFDAENHSGALTVGANAEIPICTNKTAVTDFVFKGNGTLSSIKGVESTGYMAKDAAGNYWATIQQAIGNGTAPFTILYDTDFNAKYDGWKFDNSDGVWKLMKLAKGLFFMAY